MRKSFVLIILAVCVLAGCGSGGRSAKLSSDDVAVVGSQHISLTAMNNLLARAKIAYKQQGQAFPKQGTTNYQAVRDNVLTILVEQAELDQKAAAMGIKVTDAEIDARIAQVKKQYFAGSQKKYLAEIKKQGYTEAQVRTDVIRPQLISEKVQKQVIKDVKVSDAEVQKYYDDNKSSLYQQPESRDVRYILVGKNKATAQAVYQQLVKGGDKAWCTLAKKYAKDASGQNCGKATFSKGQTVAAFDQIAFSQPTKVVHAPIYDPTQYKSWFVIEPLTPVKPRQSTPEKQVATSIKQQLQQTKKNQAMTDWVSSTTKGFCSGSQIKYQVGYTPSPDPCTVTTTNATTTTG